MKKNVDKALKAVAKGQLMAKVSEEVYIFGNYEFDEFDLVAILFNFLWEHFESILNLKTTIFTLWKNSLYNK
ncbi:hypothetical protein [Flagellimonas sp.]|uniref:hypothetical protein n=1 Tax=Flagellimonas sp. TaxID=2058762 RepID=UPI003F4A7CD3